MVMIYGELRILFLYQEKVNPNLSVLMCLKKTLNLFQDYRKEFWVIKSNMKKIIFSWISTAWAQKIRRKFPSIMLFLIAIRLIIF